MTAPSASIAKVFDFEYIFHEVPDDERFHPKSGRSPRRKKWLDTRNVRRLARCMSSDGKTVHSFPNHQLYDDPPNAAVSYRHASRIRKIRRRSGQIAQMKAGNVLENSNSIRAANRTRMHLKERWWQEAVDTLKAA